MAYTPELKELIKKVEQTRLERVARKQAGKEFPALTLEERGEVLQKFHPDFLPNTKRALKAGPSKGYEIPHEYADILEASSRVEADSLRLGEPDYDTDVLVIGGGGAGTAAALMAAENGASVLIATKLRHGDANTMMAEGGIQAVTKKEKDTLAAHYLDVLGGGHFVNDKELVATLVREAPYAMAWLEKLGCLFSKFEDGRLKSMHGGGTSRKRMHYAGDITGAEIMRTLRDEARNHPDRIRVVEFSPAVELILDEKGQCCGAVLFNLETEEYRLVRAKATIIATGGSGRLHVQQFMTTNHYGATGDGLTLAYRAGVPVKFLHTVQYHPTGTVFPEQAEGLLITEKFRGAGANLVNIDGEQFVYEREPRDVEAACIIRECSERKKGITAPNGKVGVWLDSPMIDMLEGEGTVRREFPGKHILFRRYGIDISKEPMLIFPTLHYQNGGLEIKPNCETRVPNLYAAGEVTGGVHGENRLMGNSLLDVIVYGRIAGRTASGRIKKVKLGTKPSLNHAKKFDEELAAAKAGDSRVAPVLLPDYVNPEVKERHRVVE